MKADSAWQPTSAGKLGADEAEVMATLIFWVLWLTVTAYLYQQWQRYEPTRLAIDGLAAVAALPFAVVILVALI